MTKPKAEPIIKRERPPGGRGRSKLIPNLKVVKDLASQGLTGKQIALALGIDFTTLQDRRKEYEEIDRAILEGQAKGIATVTNALFQMATKDRNVAAAIFYLKNRDSANWKDKVQVENEFVLPAPLIIETVKEAQVIDVVAEPTPALKDKP